MIVTVNREIPAHPVCDKFWHGTGGIGLRGAGHAELSAERTVRRLT
jgi:hypothetical protein